MFCSCKTSLHMFCRCKTSKSSKIDLCVNIKSTQQSQEYFVFYDIIRSEIEKNHYEANALAIVVRDGHKRLLFIVRDCSPQCLFFTLEGDGRELQAEVKHGCENIV